MTDAGGVEKCAPHYFLTLSPSKKTSDQRPQSRSCMKWTNPTRKIHGSRTNLIQGNIYIYYY